MRQNSHSSSLSEAALRRLAAGDALAAVLAPPSLVADGGLEALLLLPLPLLVEATRMAALLELPSAATFRFASALKGMSSSSSEMPPEAVVAVVGENEGGALAAGVAVPVAPLEICVLE